MGLRPHMAELQRPWEADGARGPEDHLFFSVATEGLADDQPADFTAEAQGLALYLRALYAAIFLIGGRQLARPVIEGMLRAGLQPLRGSADRYLTAFANQQPVGLPEPGWRLDAALLQAACDRTRVSQLLDPSVITLVAAVWGDKPVVADEVTVYFPQADGEIAAGRAIIPPVRVVSPPRTGPDGVTPPFWRWFHSICPADSAVDWSIDTFATVAAKAALPLNPLWVLRTDPRGGADVGIPFANYMAMGMMEALLLSRSDCDDWADQRYAARRKLQLRLQCRFFGGGGFTLCDRDGFARFWDQRRKLFGELDGSLFGVLINQAAGPDYQRGSALAIFACEALVPSDDHGADHPGGTELESATDAADVGAHGDDEDPTQDLPNEEVEDATTEGGDDPMADPAAAGTTDPAAAPLDNTMLQGAGANSVSNDIDPFTMATMDKGLSAYLFRRGVAAVFARLSTDPTSTISPSSLAMLRYWCNQWPNVASVDATKSLLAKLGLTQTLRPFTRN